MTVNLHYMYNKSWWKEHLDDLFFQSPESYTHTYLKILRWINVKRSWHCWLRITTAVTRPSTQLWHPVEMLHAHVLIFCVPKWLTSWMHSVIYLGQVNEPTMHHAWHTPDIMNTNQQSPPVCYNKNRMKTDSSELHSMQLMHHLSLSFRDDKAAQVHALTF